VIDFLELPLSGNIGLLAAGSVAVWLAGTRLSVLAHRIAVRTSLTEAYVGLLLLAASTSLPELATSTTASVAGNAQLATSNLLGGVAMQTAVLGIVDAVGLKGALTYFSPGPVLLMQAVFIILLLGIVIAAAAAGTNLSLLNVGAGTFVVAIAYVAGLYLLKRYESHPGWQAVNPPEVADITDRDEKLQSPPGDTPLSSLLRSFALLCLVVLAAGWLVAETADAVAVQSGIGATFVGATLLAAASSLPELSTTIQAARQGAYRMAISNIFGSNVLDITLLFVADVCYRGGPILAEAPTVTVFTAALGIVLTCLYLGGLLERGDRAVLRLGWDSVSVLVVYGAGLWILYGFK
jgi:cation:H+ antiporter